MAITGELFSGPGSSVGIATELRAGRSGDRIPVGRDFPPVQTGPGTHPASCTMGTGPLPGVKYGRGVLLTTHPLLVPRSWKSRAIPLPTLWATTGPVTGILYLFYWWVIWARNVNFWVCVINMHKELVENISFLLWVAKLTKVRNVEDISDKFRVRLSESMVGVNYARAWIIFIRSGCFSLGNDLKLLKRGGYGKLFKNC